ncbi:MAG TPA: TonB-dependent receptor [Bacteroidales bacterium]|nr:TonB-dependent receptor [Bacteroidales bacterium]
MKRFIFLTFVAFLSGFGSLRAETTAKGVVKDADTGNPLPGVTIQVQGTSISVLSDANGEYQLTSLPSGNYTINYTLIGFQPFEMQVDVKDGDLIIPEVLLKHAQSDESQNQTLSEVTISSDDLDMDSKSESVTGMLQSSADPFEAAVSYVFSPARFKIRGYDSEYSLTYMNGIPVNDPESGFGSWSVWGGLNDVTRNRESRYGLLTSDFSFGGIGGVVNLNTRASQARIGTKISYASTNRTYTNRLMVTHSTGLMENGFAYTVSASRRWAEEGYVEGTFYDAYAYFVSVEKKFNSKHSLAFTAFNAPTKRGMQGAASDEANRLVGSNFYNPNWGYQNGEKRNARVRKQQEPTFMLNHYWNINEKMSLTTNAGYSFGTFQTTALNWYNAQDPRPDYYRKLPSYYSLSADEERIATLTDSWKNDVNTQQINWDELYQTNYDALDTAKYIIENRITDSKQLSFSTALNWDLKTNLKIKAGLEASIYKGRNYKTMNDLLGGDYWVDIDQFAERDFGDHEIAQNDLDHPDRQIKEGDTFGNDYTANVNKGSLWAVANYMTNHFDYYVGASFDYSQFWRTGHMRNGRFPTNSKGDSEKQQFNNFGIKGGTTWKINGRNFVEANAAYLTMAPFFRNSFVSPRTSNRIVDGLINEKIASADINYNLRSPYIKARISAYYTLFMDQNELKSFYSENEKTFVNYSMTGIDKVHKGLELGAEIKATAALKVKLAASMATYQFISRPYVTITKDNSGDVVDAGKSIYIKNFYIPNTPQTAAMIGLDYAAPKYLYLSANVSYFGDTYIDFSPDRRSPEVVDPEDPNIKVLTEQQSVPSAILVDASVGKSWRINKYFINLNFSVSNIFDKTDFSTGGYEQLRYGSAEDVKRFPPRHYYAFGRTYYLILGLRF